MSSLRETLTHARGGIFTTVQRPEQVRALAQEAGWRVCEADVSRAYDKSSLLDVVARDLEFPAYFGHNWDAFADCLADITGDPGVLLVWHGDTGLPPQVRTTAYEVLADRAEDAQAPFVAVVSRAE